MFKISGKSAVKFSLFASIAIALSVSLSSCSTKAPPENEIRKVVVTQQIIALDDTVGTWITGGLFSSSGSSTVDYMYAVRNPNGSISQHLTSEIKVDYLGTPYTPQFIDIFEDTNGEEARIDSMTCVSAKSGEICAVGYVGLHIHVPVGSVKLTTTVDGPK